MRKVAAHYWLRPDASVGKFPIVTFDNTGRILEIRERDEFQEEPFLELVNGFLVPGFVDIYKADIFALDLSSLKKILNAYFVSGIKLLGVKAGCVSEIKKCAPKQMNIVSTHVDGDTDCYTFDKIKKASNTMEALKCFTSTNARLLNEQENFGTIEIGKSPGLLSIQGMNYNNFQISDMSKIKRLL